MLNNRIYVFLFIAIAGFALFSNTHTVFASDQSTTDNVIDVYYNNACGSCGTYVEETLTPELESRGYSIELKNYVDKYEYRGELTKRSDDLNIPFELRAHLVTFMPDALVIAGHVQKDVLKEILDTPRDQLADTFVIFQDKMPEMLAGNDPLEYSLWPDKNNVVFKTTKSPILEGYVPGEPVNVDSKRGLLPLILSAGFLDGLNPCAFGVLLFFIGFLYAIKRSRGKVLAMGSVYILGIFVAYVGIGFGLMQAISISSVPHFLAKFASWLIIALGLLQLVSIVYPNFKFKLGIPEFTKPSIQKAIHKTTLPAALIAGFVVGLCTFPCSGGIYIAVIGLLASEATRVNGVGLVLLYNVMFVLPLVIVLALATNTVVIRKIETMKQKNHKLLSIIMSITMVFVGLIILLFFV